MNLGIIAEYNPFHNGHLLHINKSRELTNANNTIAVMSGNFLQRGEPAIINKQLRTKMALLNGVDMVLELPVEYSTGAADVFALGAIDIMNKSGIINSLSFGSEQGDISLLSDIANLLTNETSEFKYLLLSELKKGVSYPLARAEALTNLGYDTTFINSPNNILAIEYLKSLNITNSKITPYTIPRENNNYHQKELTGIISSATAIRTAVQEKQLALALNSMPINCHDIFTNAIGEYAPTINDYSSALHYILRTSTADKLSKISDITEGLENRILNNANTKLITEIIDKIKTKRYTYTKLQRALLHILLDIKKIDYKPNGVEYIRVLGFKKERSYLLKELMQNSSVPVITNVKENEHLIKREIVAADIYYMPTSMQIGTEYTTPLVIV